MGARRWLLIALVAIASCKKKKEPEPEPDPGPRTPATGHSVTKVKTVEGGDGEASGSSGSATSPVKPSGKSLDGLTALSVGRDRACAINVDDKLWCWQPQAAAEPMDAPGPVVAVSNAACAILEDKSVWCWPHHLELIAAGSTGAGQISASATDVCATRRLFVWCWKPDEDHARRQFDWAGVDRIALGNNGRACTVVSGSEIECMNVYTDERPELLAQPQDVATLAMQGNVSCVTHNKGTVECWTDPRQRQAIPGISNASEIALGPEGDACVIAGGSVTCWKLAAGQATIERQPSPVSGFTATAIGVGAGFACALADDKRARCWSTSDGKAQIVMRK